MVDLLAVPGDVHFMFNFSDIHLLYQVRKAKFYFQYLFQLIVFAAQLVSSLICILMNFYIKYQRILTECSFCSEQYSCDLHSTADC